MGMPLRNDKQPLDYILGLEKKCQDLMANVQSDENEWSQNPTPFYMEQHTGFNNENQQHFQSFESIHVAENENEAAKPIS